MPKLCITIDIDWAPDFMIKPIADLCVEHNLQATWFITHDSKIIRELQNTPLFEVGIHPNLSLTSTQGKNEPEIVHSLLDIVPDARAVRSHGNVQSTNLTIRLAKNYGLKVDSSYFLPRVKNVTPHPVNWLDSSIIRAPYTWEDGYEASQSDPIWSLDNPFFDQAHPIVLNFHPVHLHLNTTDYPTYILAKAQGPIQNWTKETNLELVYEGVGTRTFFESLLTSSSVETIKMSELCSDESRN